MPFRGLSLVVKQKLHIFCFKFFKSEWEIQEKSSFFLQDWPSNKSLCLQFLAIIYNFTFHTRSDFPLTILRARRWTELATDVFTAGLTWWTCHILTEILIERVLKTIFLLWPNWLFISPLIWPSIAIKMPAHHTEQNCLQAALSLKSNTFSLLWICSLTRKLGRKNNWEDLWKGTHNFVGCCLALSPIN